MGVGDSVDWVFDRSVVAAVDIDDGIKFGIDDGSDMGSSNGSFLFQMTEKLRVSF